MRSCTLPTFLDSGIKLVQNELGAFSTIAGFTKLSDNEELLMIMTAACFFLDMGSALIEIKYWGIFGATGTARTPIAEFNV